MRNIKHSEQTKKKISQSLKGKKKSYETRQRMSMAKKAEWQRAKDFANHTTMAEYLCIKDNTNYKKEEHEEEV